MMYKLKSLLLIIILFSFINAEIRTISDSEAYQKSKEYQKLAEVEMERGDYDKSYEYSKKAKEYAFEAEKYRYVVITRYDAFKLRRDAVYHILEAEKLGVQTNEVTVEYHMRATNELSIGTTAYDSCKDKTELIFLSNNYTFAYNSYSNALYYAKEALAIRLYAGEINRILDEAIQGHIFLKQNEIIAEGDENDQEISDLIGSSKKFLQDKKYIESLKDAKSALDRIITLRQKHEADSLVVIAEKKRDTLKTDGVPETDQSKFEEASGFTDIARSSLENEDYLNAINNANKAIHFFDSIKKTETFPMYYSVRFIPRRRDCLWRIAEYAFIYNDGYKWKNIYDANKEIFKGRSENLIYPGEVFVIPSLSGENRTGKFNPDSDYSHIKSDKK